MGRGPARLSTSFGRVLRWSFCWGWLASLWPGSGPVIRVTVMVALNTHPPPPTPTPLPRLWNGWAIPRTWSTGPSGLITSCCEGA